MPLRILAFAASLALLGCEQLVSDQDRETKAKVVGHWLHEVDSERDGAAIREHIVHAADGKFTLERMIVAKDGAVTREHASGSWFVTASLYKMRTEYIGREQLPNAQQLYSTCKIETLSAEELVCSNDVDKWTKRQRRVPSDFKL